MRQMTEKDVQTFNTRVGSGDFQPGTILEALQQRIIQLETKVQELEEAVYSE